MGGIGKARREHEELQRLTRALRLLNRCNLITVHAQDEKKLLKDICRLAVGEGRYELAWVGLAKAGRAHPMAHAGSARLLRLALRENRGQGGPANRVIRSGKPAALKSARPANGAGAYSSAIFLPLTDSKGRVFGTLSLYERDPRAFDKEEMKLLADLANDLSFSLTTLRLREQQKEAAEMLRKLKLAVAQSLDGIVVADLKGTVQFANHSWVHMHGYSTHHEVAGNHLGIFHTKGQLRRELAPFLKSVRKKGSKQGEVGHMRRGGEAFPTWTSFTLLRDEAGKPFGFVGVARDITETKQAEGLLRHYARDLENAVVKRTEEVVREKSRVEELSKAKDNFIRDLSHELKTPLSVILGNIMLLRDLFPAERGPDALKLLGMLERNAVRLRASIDEILQLSKMDAFELICEPIQLRKMLDEVYSEHLPLAKMKGIWLRWDAEDAEVMGDRKLLRLAMNNLVSNAIKFTERGGVSIVLRKLRGGALIRVSDTGRGIPAEHHPKLFTKYFKADPNAPGTGIGLSVVKGIIDKHNGEIKFRSKPGSGSTFEMIIPGGGADEKGADNRGRA